jgi:hypothetical protein
MRILATAFLLLALPLGAFAQRHYAILSLVGDEMIIVQREMSVGSHLDTNSRQAVQMPDATIDRAVLLAVEDAVRKSDPNARPRSSSRAARPSTTRSRARSTRTARRRRPSRRCARSWRAPRAPRT